MTRPRIARMLWTAALVALAVQPAGRAHADTVTDWNVIALNATAVPPNSILQSRVLAIVHGAVHDAVRAVDPRRAAYAVALTAPAGANVDVLCMMIQPFSSPMVVCGNPSDPQPPLMASVQTGPKAGAPMPVVADMFRLTALDKTLPFA